MSTWGCLLVKVERMGGDVTLFQKWILFGKIAWLMWQNGHLIDAHSFIPWRSHCLNRKWYPNEFYPTIFWMRRMEWVFECLFSCQCHINNLVLGTEGVTKHALRFFLFINIGMGLTIHPTLILKVRLKLYSICWIGIKRIFFSKNL